MKGQKFIDFNKKRSPLLIFLLILSWVVLKLGEVTINFFVSFIKIAAKILTYQINLPKIPNPEIHLPKLKLFDKKPKDEIVPQVVSKPKKKKKKKRKKQLKITKILNTIFPTPLRIAVLLIILLGGFFFYSLFLVVVVHELPSPEKLSSNSGPITSEFYDRNGTLLYRLYEGKNRTPVKLEDLPSNLVKATISMEDKNFYTHSGIDLYGVGRAAVAFVQKREVQGGSTITQQLIKNTLLTPERTISRKAKEIILAFWAERIFSKDEILTMYFNEAPYGGPAWGISAAATTYFGKEPKDLTLAEAAYLAGLPASPTTYSPYGSNPELGKDRQKEVLRRMVEDNYISKEEADKASTEELAIKPPNTEIKAPHFVMYLRSLLAEKYGEKTVSQGGLKVYTTLDLGLQEMAEKIVADEVANLGYLNVSNGAAMITDAKTGQILAMVGSKNYWDPSGGNFNVTTALRQPGSSIKPITYVTAFKKGYSPGNVLLDSPVSFRNEWETYQPVNYDGRFHGPVSIRTALGSSYNVPAVKMLAIVGLPDMIQTAKDLGITTFSDPNRYGLSLTLGGGEVRLIDMMTAYGTFSQLGIKHSANPIIKLVDGAGVTLENHQNDKGLRVLDSSVAYLITDILADNKARTPAFGQNSLLNITGKTVAVKTGTTDNKRDNWTFGYTPEYVVGVWVGNNDNSPMNPQLSSGVTGAAPIWNKIMSKLLENRQNLAFERPSDVVETRIDGNRDLKLSGIEQKSVIGRNTKKEPSPQGSPSEKETITFTDPFSTFTIDSNSQPIP